MDEEIKLGSVVYLNSNPETKFTVLSLRESTIRVLYFNSLTNKLEQTLDLPKKAFTLAKDNKLPNH